MYKHRVVFTLLVLVLALVMAGCTTSGQEAAVPSAPTTAAPTAVPAISEPAMDDAADDAAPEEVVTAFYAWYLDYIGQPGSDAMRNPLVDGAYQTSPHLSAAFKAQVAETIAGFDRGGFDPILLAQDVPVRFEVQNALVEGAAATVDALLYWGGNPDPSLRTVHLRQENGRWLIDNVTAEAPAGVQTPEVVVGAFYAWYLDYIGDPASETFRNPLVDQAYHDAPFLSASFVEHVDELLAEMREQGAGGYDPFLCAQAIPTAMTPDVTFARNNMASVAVRSSFPNHMLAVDLRPEGDSWRISNITCASDPAGVATVFYTWYLGYVSDRATGDFRNPLVDKAYQDHPLLSEAFVAEVDALLAGFDRGGYDPFLLAQDIPQDFSVDPGVVEGTAVVHLQFGPSSVKHLLVTLDERSRRISAIAENELLPASAPEEEPGGGMALAVNVSEEYGFSFGYPVDWVLQAEPVGGPGMPDDWPVQAIWFLMPQDVADLMASRSGPPDPNAPVIVAPFQIEAVVGDAQAMERVYYDFAEGERTAINNQAAIILRRDPGYSHFIFPHPQRPGTWIVITDWVTEFPGREAQGATAVPVLPALLNSLAFVE
jgi:hypothetical protein